MVVGGMKMGMVDDARTFSPRSWASFTSARVQATVSPVFQSMASICISAGLAAKVSQSKAMGSPAAAFSISSS